MNPYASFLGSRDAVEVIAATPGRLRSLFASLEPARAGTPAAPGKWSAREILCHLADCEIVFAFRLRQTLAEKDHVVQPFDQDLWAARYGGLTVDAAMAVFHSVREWNLALIRAATPGDFSTPVTHPERGTMTFRTIVETMGGHDINHLQQLETISSRTAA